MQKGSATDAVSRHLAALLEKSGAQVGYVDLRELQLPFFEEKAARSVAQYQAIAPAIDDADGYVLATPDYHGNPSGALKNFLDYFWREFTGKLFGYVCLSYEKGTTAMDALRIAVRQCYGWSLPYGVSVASRVDLEPGGAVRSEALRSRLEMMASDMMRYSALLGTERRRGLIESYPTFMAALRQLDAS
jgi:FMN reductase